MKSVNEKKDLNKLKCRQGEKLFLDEHRLETISIYRELLSLGEKQDCYRQSSFVGTRRNQASF